MTTGPKPVKIFLTNSLEGKEETDDIKWTTNRFEATHMLLNGIHYVRGPGGNWFAPDYTQPGTAEAVKKSVDEAYDAHWSIDRWRK